MLQKQIRSNMVAAMKTKNQEETSLLRVVLAECDRKGKNLPDVEVIKIINKMVENAKEQNNQLEIDILTPYLPRMLEPKEIKVIVESIIKTNNIESIKDMGKVMAELKKNPEIASIDMKTASQITKEILNK